MQSVLSTSPQTTGFIVMLPDDALTAFSILLGGQRRRIPADVSLIALFDEPYMDATVPPLTRYRCNDLRLARHVARLSLQIAANAGRPRSVLLIPELVKGGTMAGLADRVQTK